MGEVALSPSAPSMWPIRPPTKSRVPVTVLLEYEPCTLAVPLSTKPISPPTKPVPETALVTALESLTVLAPLNKPIKPPA